MKKSFLEEKNNVRDSIKKLETLKVILIPVLNKMKNVVGTITDGDIRRGLLLGKKLSDNVSEIMNCNPIVGSSKHSKNEIQKYMKLKNINAIPLVDESGVYQHVLNSNKFENINLKSNYDYNVSTALIMAGGEGKRLHPITQKIPKPLVNIGGEPILMKTIKKLQKSGVKEVFISINYLSDQIENYLNDNDKLKIKISFLKELDKSGTAGSINLLPKHIKGPILVLNGDLLFEADIQNLVNYHNETKADATIGIVNYNFEIPFGVVKLSNDQVVNIEEKPTQNFFCSAGIYIIESDVIFLNEKYEKLDMPDYMSKLIKLKKKVVGFPIHEYWTDIGTKIDLNKARSKYGF